MGRERGTRQPEPLRGPAANLAGEPEQALLDRGVQGDLRWEQGRDQLTELGQAQFWTGFSRDCRLWGQSPGEPFPSPITVLLGSSGVSLRVVLAMGHFFIGGISSMPPIFAKHLLSQLWLGLASGSKSHEDKGQASCIGAIS